MGFSEFTPRDAGKQDVQVATAQLTFEQDNSLHAAAACGATCQWGSTILCGGDTF